MITAEAPVRLSSSMPESPIGLVFSREEILERIPHGPRFCFIDSVTISEEDGVITGIGMLAITPEHCEDHFPHAKGLRQIFPKVLCEEAGAQAGLVLATVLNPAIIGQVAVFTEDTICRTFAPALPGQTLTLRSRLTTPLITLVEASSGEAICDGYVGKVHIFTMRFAFSFMTKEDFNRMADTFRFRCMSPEERKALKVKANGS